MQKTKLGISVGLLGATIYFTSLVGGYTVPIFLTGYILLFEENEWLKKTSVKAVSLAVFFSLLITVLNFVPNTIDFVDSIFDIFNGDFHISFLTRLITAIIAAIEIAEKILFILLGIKALNQASISISIIDKLINKYM